MSRVLGKYVPAISLVVCTLLIWGAWSMTATQAPPPELAVKAPVAIVSQRPIRVGVTPEPQASVAIEISEPFHVTAVGSPKVLLKAPRLARTTVTATPRGLKIGKHELSVTRLEIVADKTPAVWIEGHQYRGRMRLFRASGGKVLAVNVLPLEEYVASVIDSEMPGDFPDEARKAQAIVARTYAIYQMQQAGRDAPLDLYASTRSQKYLGFQYRDGSRLLAGESVASRRIAAETRGQVCTYQGQVFCTYYCAVCGGGTVKGTEVFSDAAAPLAVVKCDWCKEANLYRWTAQVAKRDAQADIAPLLGRDGKKPGTLKSVSVVRAKGAGSLSEFDLKSDRQTVRVSGAELRQALAGRGLYSPRFTVEDQGNTWRISGRGHGHGVGLCQWGARGLALSGKTSEQILAYYYPGMQLTTLKSPGAAPPVKR